MSAVITDAISNNMPKDKLRTLVYNTDVNTLLQDGLEKVINGYTTFEEVIKLIELDDDIDDNKLSSYKYDLNKALEHTEISKTSQINTNDINSALNQQPVVQPNVVNNPGVVAQPATPQTNIVAAKPQIPTNQPLCKEENSDDLLIEDELEKTQVLDI